MAIQLDFSPAKRPKKDALTKLAKALVQVASGRVLGSLVGFYEAFDAYEPADPTPEQQACAFWRAVLSLALADTLGRNRIARLLDEEELSRAIADALKPIFEPAEDVTFSEQDLIEPTRFQLYPDMRERYPDFVKRVDPECEHEPDVLKRLLDSSLRSALYRIWADERSDGFRRSVDAAFSGSVYEGFRRRLAWQRHTSWIDHPLYAEPLFGQDKDSGITLRAVYTPLRCAFHEEVPLEEDENQESAELRSHDRKSEFELRTRRVAHVGWLQETLTSWLDEDDRRDTVRVVAGGPGSGKSTSARVFAVDTSNHGTWNVAFIELQHVTFKGDLDMRLAEHFERESSGMGLGGDPLKWQDDDDRPLLFVFDGLDEVARADTVSEDIARSFIRRVKALLDRHNSRDINVRAVVLGRTAAVVPACKEAELELSALLHVMPLTPLNAEVLDVDERQRDGLPDDDCIFDRLSLADDDHRTRYWDKWRRASGLHAEDLPDAIQEEKLTDLTAEPLLFYLLILSGYVEKNWQDAAENRNRVYHEIFLRVHRRDREKDYRASHGVDEEDFLLLMECLGLAIWQGGGSTGSDEDFDRLRDLHAGRRRNALRSNEAADLRSVVLQFFTRADMAADTGFEFIHKSFGEYLVGCALLRAAKRWAEEPEEDFAQHWLKLAGKQSVTEWIIDFLRNEARLMNADKRLELKGLLEQQMNWVLRDGFPAQRGGFETWREAEANQSNAAGGLLAVLNALALAVDHRTEVRQTEESPSKPSESDERDDGSSATAALMSFDWEGRSAARRMIEMLNITSDSSSAHRLLLGRLSFVASRDDHSCNLAVLNLYRADLREADLRRANLSGADLSWADLFKANLSRAILIDADLNRADLFKADLTEANLYGADLAWAILIDVDLRGANLSRANLSGADLSWADLSEADLSWADMLETDLRGANLGGANLRGADLFEANLRRADLSGANLSRGNLSGANLKGADLSGVNLSRTEITSANFAGSLLVSADCIEAVDLSPTQVASAFGDASTNLPSGTLRPSHWPDEQLSTEEVIGRWEAWRENRDSQDGTE